MRPIKLEIEGLQSFKEKQTIDFEKLTEFGLFGIFGKTGSGKSTILDGMILALFDEIPRNKIDGNKSSLLNSINDSSKKMEVYYSFALGKDIYEIKRSYKRGISKGQEIIKPKDAILIKNGNILANKKTEVKNILNEDFGLDVDDFSRTVVLPQGKFNEFLKLRGKEKIEMLEKIFALEKYGEKLEKKIFSEKNYWNKENEKYRNQIIGKGEINPEEIKELKNLLEEKKENLLNKEQEKKEFDRIYEEEKILRELLDKNIQLTISKDNLLKNKNIIDEYKMKIEKNDLGRELKSQMEELALLKERLEERTKEKNELEKSKIKEDINIENLKETKKKLLEEKEKYVEEKNSINFSIEELRKVNKLYEEKTSLLIKKNQQDIIKENIIIKEEEIKENTINSKKTKKELENTRGDIKLVGEIERNLLKKMEETLKEKIEYINEAKNKKNEKEIKEELLKKLTEERKTIVKEKEIYLTKIKDKNKKLKESFAYRLYEELKEGEPCPVCGSIHHKKMEISNEKPNGLELEIENLLKEKDDKIAEDSKLLEKINNLENELNSFKIKFEKLNIEEEEKEIEKQKIILEEEKINIEKKENKLKELNIKIIQKESEQISLSKDEKRLTGELNDLKGDNLKLIKELKEKDIEILEKYGEISENTIEVLKEKKIYLEKNQDKTLKLQSKIEKLIEQISDNYDATQLNALKLEKIKGFIIKNKTELKIINDDIHIKSTKFQGKLASSIFNNQYEVEKSILDDEKYVQIKSEVNNYEKDMQRILTLLDENTKLINGRSQSLEKWEELKIKNKELKEISEMLKIEISTLEKEIKDKKILLDELKEIMKLKKNAEKKYEVAEELGKKLKGRAFVEFLSVKKLKSIVSQASNRLKRITNGRYQLLSDDECDFYVIDYFNEGSKRRCSTLSGGETFIVSLCLALALSNQMQLKGKIQLEFFFLDEGFGTLDEKLLDKVIESLENINNEEKLKVGIITHLEELKIKIIRSLEVIPAVPGIKGSCVKII
ncbi:MAG: SMC family ATPase [Fusobacterium sp.]